MDTTIHQDDPRLCRQWEINLSTDGKAVFVVLFLGRAGEHVPMAIHGMTPAEAREVALVLCDGAEQADRRMNEAVQVGKEGV